MGAVVAGFCVPAAIAEGSVQYFIVSDRDAAAFVVCREAAFNNVVVTITAESVGIGSSLSPAR